MATVTGSNLSTVARQSAFQERVQYYMIKAAIAILNGTPDTADTILGQSVLDNNESVYMWSLAVLTNPTIAAGAHEENGSTVSDGDIEFTVNSYWSAFKK